MELKDRIIYARNLTGMSQTALAKAVGMAQASLSDLEIGKTSSSRYFLEIAKICGVSPIWLQTGAGDPKDDNVTMLKNYVDNEKKRKDESVIDIPLFNVTASMGTGIIPSEFQQAVVNLSVEKNFFSARNIPISTLSNLAIINASGDSMEPTFNNGDLIIIDKGITAFKGDGIYIFSLSNELYVKRLQKLPSCIKMISDNNKYPAYDIKGEELNSLIIHGKVLFTWNGKSI